MKTILPLAALLTLTAPAWGYSVDYQMNLYEGSAPNGATGSAQVTMTVSDGGNVAGLAADQALFRFSHAGPGTFFVTNIYFGGASALSLDGIQGSVGVNYQRYTPANGKLGRPAGGQNIDWAQQGYTSFRFDPQGSQSQSGIGAGEWLKVLFDLDGGTLADVLADLEAGDLRIAFHAQGFDDGGSAGFVNGGTVPVMAPPTGLDPDPVDVTQVPVPATLALFGAGLLVLAGRRQAVKG